LPLTEKFEIILPVGYNLYFRKTPKLKTDASRFISRNELQIRFAFDFLSTAGQAEPDLSDSSRRRFSGSARPAAEKGENEL